MRQGSQREGPVGDDVSTQVLIGAIFDHGKADSVFNGAIDEASAVGWENRKTDSVFPFLPIPREGLPANACDSLLRAVVSSACPRAQVRLWSVDRTQSEIVESMKTTLTGLEYGLVGYWHAPVQVLLQVA